MIYLPLDKLLEHSVNREVEPNRLKPPLRATRTRIPTR